MRVWVVTWGCHSAVRDMEHCKCSDCFFFSSDLQKWSSPILKISPLVLKTAWVRQPILRKFLIRKRDICTLGLAKARLHNFKLSKVMKETFLSRLRSLCTHAMQLQLFIGSSEMQLGGNPPEILRTQLFEEAFSLSLNTGDQCFLGFGSEHILWPTKLAFWKHYDCRIKLEHNPRVSNTGVLLLIFN